MNLKSFSTQCYSDYENYYGNQSYDQASYDNAYETPKETQSSTRKGRKSGGITDQSQDYALPIEEGEHYCTLCSSIDLILEF